MIVLLICVSLVIKCVDRMCQLFLSECVFFLFNHSFWPCHYGFFIFPIICKRYYIETLTKELGFDNCSNQTGNSTYTSCQMSSEDIVNTHDTS